MIYPDVDLDKWIEKNDLEIVDYVCPGGCGKTYQTTVPVVTKESNGLQSPLHECGEGYWAVIMTPRTAEALAFWEKLV